jgi:hypothetical protein
MKLSIKDLGRLAHVHEGMRMPFVYPAREWAIGLLVGILVLIGGMIHASLLYVSASNETEAATVLKGDEAPLPYRDREARAVIEAYEARARAFTDMRGTLLPPAPATDDEEAEETPEAPSDAVPVAE